MQENKIDQVGWVLLLLLFLTLGYSGWLSYKAIDWDVLKRMEAIPLVLPTQAPIATPSSSLSPTIAPPKK